MISTSVNSITKIQKHETSKDRSPKKSLTKRLTKVSQLLNGEKAYESPSSMKNYLSDEGIDRWKRLKYFANALNDKTAFGRNQKSGSISSRDYYLVNHGGHKNKHSTLISRNTSPGLKLIKSATNPVFDDIILKSQKMNKLALSNSFTKPEASNSGYASVDLKSIPARADPLNFTPTNNSHMASHSTNSPHAQKYCHSKVVLELGSTKNKTYLKKMNKSSSGFNVKPKSAKAISNHEVIDNNDHSTSAIHKLTNIYSLMERKSINQNPLQSPQTQNMSKTSKIKQNLIMLERIDSQDDNKSMLTPKTVVKNDSSSTARLTKIAIDSKLLSFTKK